MPVIGPSHLERLVELESGVHYNQPPPPGVETFVVVERPSAVLLSAPHGAVTFRNSTREVWHDEDEYTAGMALLLGEVCGVSVVATTWKNIQYDPNNTCKDGLPYRNAVRRLIDTRRVRFVLDIHGASLHTEVLDPEQTIDLGYRQMRGKPSAEQPNPPSMEPQHIARLEALLEQAGRQSIPDCFVVDHNHFAARGPATITTLAVEQGQRGPGPRVQALQIEMKPPLRTLRRFPAASQYKTQGEYRADPGCVRAMLQALADFIGYLETAA